jgi:hypothetical protein
MRHQLIATAHGLTERACVEDRFRIDCGVAGRGAAGVLADCALRLACELASWKDPFCIDTLAAAYAECGQFSQAVERQKQAIDLASEKKKADFRSRLELYEAGKPYREERRGKASRQ